MALKKTISVLKIGDSEYFLIPSSLRDDSQFPFNLDEDKLTMKVVGTKIIIEKKRKEKDGNEND